MIIPFCAIYVIAILYLVKKTRCRVLVNEAFWLLASWCFIFGIYFLSGVTWKYQLSVITGLYIILCFSGFFLFRRLGMKVKIRRKGNHVPKSSRFQKDTNGVLNPAVHRRYIALGYIGGLLFTVDFIRLNGLILSEKSSYRISFMGSLGSLLIPILLVLGLYRFCIKLRDKNKIDLIAILMLASYMLPCFLNSGRESIIYVLIGIISVYAYVYCLKGSEKHQRKPNSIRIKSLVIFLVIGILIIFSASLIINISYVRYGLNEINTYLRTHNVSDSMRAEGDSLGKFRFLYYNIVSYFDHQLPFLEFLFKEYQGPYMFGLYELNVISRRLPEFLKLDYNLVYDELTSLYFQHGQSFNGCWQTLLGSLIIDFGRFFAVGACCILGTVVGVIRKRFLYNWDIHYAILIALVCIGMFTTIQLGPFYNTLIYGSFIWWYLIFRRV